MLQMESWRLGDVSCTGTRSMAAWCSGFWRSSGGLGGDGVAAVFSAFARCDEGGRGMGAGLCARGSKGSGTHALYVQEGPASIGAEGGALGRRNVGRALGET